MNKTEVAKYFNMLGGILDREGLHQCPHKIYNVDETGLPMINRPGIVLAQKGERSVVSITDTERGENVTVVGCCNATGQYIPPYVIMKGKRMKEDFKDGLPPASELAMSDTSYINTGLFLEWLKFFRQHAVAGKVLLIIDGHSSHVKSTTILEYCIANDIILVCLPSHTTKYLQPLDRSVYKSLKSNFQNVTNLFKRRNPELSITKYRFGALFNAAWERSATIANATSGFRASGIYPFDPSAIPNEAYLPSETTERELVDEHVVEDTDTESEANDESVPSTTAAVPSTTAVVPPDAPMQPFSDDQSDDVDEDQPSTSTRNVSFSDLQPLPKVNRPQTKSKRKQRSGELTTDEYISEIKESEQKRKLPKTKGKSKPNVHKGKTTKKKVTQKNAQAVPVPRNSDKNPATFCHYCDAYFYDDEGAGDVDWIECQMCGCWAHEDCAGAYGHKTFVCDDCEDSNE